MPFSLPGTFFSLFLLRNSISVSYGMYHIPHICLSQPQSGFFKGRRLSHSLLYPKIQHDVWKPTISVKGEMIKTVSVHNENNFWKPFWLECQREWCHLLAGKAKYSQRREKVDTPYCQGHKLASQSSLEDWRLRLLPTLAKPKFTVENYKCPQGSMSG